MSGRPCGRSIPRRLPEPRLLRRLPAAVLARADRACGPRWRRSRCASSCASSRPLLDAARAALGAFVGADPTDLVFVANATTGVNAVLRSLALAPGRRAAHHRPRLQRLHATRCDFVAARAGARVVVAPMPFPIAVAGRGRRARCSAAVTPRTRLALLDHVTSPTALVLPIERLVAELGRARRRHARRRRARARAWCRSISARSAPRTTRGNCHKWLCAPKGVGVPLGAPRSPGASVRPLDDQPRRRRATRPDRSRFRLEFDWTGTSDPTALADRAEGDRVHGRARARRLARADGAQPRAGARGARACSAPRARHGAALPGRDDRLARERASCPTARRPTPAWRRARSAPGAALRRLPHRGADRSAGPRRRGGSSASPPSSTTAPSQYERLADALRKELAAERR